MEIELLKTAQEYGDAYNRIYTLINNTENAIEPDCPEGGELELLTLFVEKYEQEHYPDGAPNPKNR